MSLPYNPEDKNSIIQFAKKFLGKNIQTEFAEDLKLLTLSDTDKGQLGKIIEKLYFKYEPNSSAKADFEEAGLELKSSGLKQLKNNEYRAKERLVLSVINYIETVNENFEDDFLSGKNGHLLLIFYLYVKGLNQLKSEIKLVGDWKYPANDIEVIKQDWKNIKQKIVDGKAHELSEGDTFYLGACTKGGKGGNPRPQPNSKILAKQRAYSLKPSYLNHIIASIAGESEEVYGKLLSSKDEAIKKSIGDIVIQKFAPYCGQEISQLVSFFELDSINPKSKQYFSLISKAILNKILDVPLNMEASSYLEEFKKADILIKTIKVEENNQIIESMSFNAFDFEIIFSENWLESEMKYTIERKFLFVFYKEEKGRIFLEKVKFWNMPLEDMNQVRKVWLQTKKIIQEGTIFNSYAKDKQGNARLSVKGNPIRENNFPKKTDNHVCHVRPHGTDSKETYPLPVADKILNIQEYSKQSFWLNNSYIRDEIYLK